MSNNLFSIRKSDLRRRSYIFLLSFAILFSIYIIGSLVANHASVFPLQAAGDDKQATSTNVRVSVLDVGQGDSILLEFPDNEVMLVDAGDREHAEAVIAALRKRGVVKIDLLVATHPHADHIGGMSQVIKDFPVAMVWSSDYNHGSRTQRDLLRLIKAEKISFQTPHAGDGRKFGQVSVDVIAPVTTIKNSESDANNNCLVLQVTFEKSSMLLAADMEADERNSIDKWPSVTVLKVAHHGSRNGTDSKFLAQLQPKLAIISCAAKNDFGHPHPETVTALAKAGVDVKCTATDGTVVFYLDGQGYTFAADTDESNAKNISGKNGVIGNRESKVFHRQQCKSLPKVQNQVIFPDRTDAVEAGYKPCERCHP